MTSLAPLVGFLLLLVALVGAALLSHVALMHFLAGYALPTPPNERLRVVALFERKYRRDFYRAHDARRDALLEAALRRMAEGELP